MDRGIRLGASSRDGHQGRGGGVNLVPTQAPVPIVFDTPEVAALMSSLAVLGPTVSESAASAMSRLVEALNPPQTVIGKRRPPAETLRAGVTGVPASSRLMLIESRA